MELKVMDHQIPNEQIKTIACKYGADLCGIASVALFHNAPHGFHPRDIYSECKTVVVIAVKLPEGIFQSTSKIPFTTTYEKILDDVIKMTISISHELEKKFKAICVPIPSEPYEYWDEVNKIGKGILSLKHAGWLAGLGSIGKNTLLTNKSFGNRIVLGALLINKESKSDEIDTFQACLKGCNLCETNCPVNAIQDGTVNQKLCRNNCGVTTKKGYFIYTCFQCRIICPNGKGCDE